MERVAKISKSIWLSLESWPFMSYFPDHLPDLNTVIQLAANLYQEPSSVEVLSQTLHSGLLPSSSREDITEERTSVTGPEDLSASTESDSSKDDLEVVPEGTTTPYLQQRRSQGESQYEVPRYIYYRDQLVEIVTADWGGAHVSVQGSR